MLRQCLWAHKKKIDGLTAGLKGVVNTEVDLKRCLNCETLMELKIAAPPLKMIVLTDQELRAGHSGRFCGLHSHEMRDKK